MSEVVNLFCVPCLSLYIYYSRKKEEPEFSAKLILQYGIVTAIICAISKAIYKLYCIFFSDTYSLGGIEYAVISLIIAVILPIAYEFLKKYISVHVEVVEDEPEQENGEKNKCHQKDKGNP